MELAGTMIGVTGEYTFSGIVQRDADGRYHAVARVFDHPDPSVSLPFTGFIDRAVSQGEARAPPIAEIETATNESEFGPRVAEEFHEIEADERNGESWIQGEAERRRAMAPELAALLFRAFPADSD